MNKNSKIYVAGHRGLVGSSILRALKREGYGNILTKTRKELELTDQKAVNIFFRKEQPDYVFLAAAKVGGILANQTSPADFIYENLAVQNNVIQAAYLNKVKKLIFLGSSCIYPRNCPQPIKEEYLLTSELEKTNEAYAIAKIAGLKMCEYYNQQYGTKYISVMPTNLYGENDNFDANSSHVLPALIGKFQAAKEKRLPELKLWGTGGPRRDFLHIDDLAEALLILMDKYDGQDGIVNIGSGTDIPIKALAEKIGRLVGYQGEIIWDKTKPDGTPRKLLAIEKMKKFGWRPRTDLDEGLKMTYAWFLKNKSKQKIENIK